MIRPLAVLDTETNMGAVNGNLTDVWCIGLYFPVDNTTKLLVGDDYDREELQSLLDTHDVIMHNASFDVWVLRQLGYTVDIEHVHDTMLMSYVLKPDGTHSLLALSELLQVETKKTHYEDFDGGYTDEMGTYCVNDCVSTYQIFVKLRSMILKDKPVYNIYRIERKFLDCIIELNHNGVFVDKESWEDIINEVQSQADSVLTQILDLVPLVPSKVYKTKNPRSADTVCDITNLELGKFWFDREEDGVYYYRKIEEFKPSSCDQVAWALTTYYDWEPTKFSEKTGKPTTDKNVLGELDYPLARLINKYNKVNKIVSTYGESLLEQVNEDGRLYGNFNQCITKTGRLSSSKPNLQNLPGSGEIGESIRRLFISSSGHVLVGCDVDSAQLRIMSWYLNHTFGSKYPDASTLFNYFNTEPDPDPHQAKADLLGVSRKEGKTLNFAVLFGAGVTKVANMLDCSVNEAKKLLQKDKESNPSLSKLIEHTQNSCKKTRGKVYDLYGRRGLYPDINSSDRSLSSRAERQVFNFLIQSTEASIIKLWLNRVFNKVRLLKLEAKLLLQVHDECLFEVVDDEEVVNTLCYVLQSELQDNEWLPGLKLTGTPSVGKNWLEVH